jgi:integrase
MCRGCLITVAEFGPRAMAEPATQLWLGAGFSLRLRTRSVFGYTRTSSGGRFRQRAATTAGHRSQETSAHALTAGQGVLFYLPRDWSLVASDALPALTEHAQALIDQFQRSARAEGWSISLRTRATRSLRILLSWLGTDAPIPETDILSLPGNANQRVLRFLASRQLVAAMSGSPTDPEECAVLARIASLPEPISGEARCWVKVLRGQGRRAHRSCNSSVIRKYVDNAYPVLITWSQTLTSLREVTPDHIRAALDERAGNVARRVQVALRSLFQALKQERVVFRDPTIGISLTTNHALPKGLPAERLGGILDRADGPRTRLIIALISVHAMTWTEIRHLRLPDLDMARGRLTVHRGGGTRHIVRLDELTHRLAAQWLTERQRLWPRTTNPHLLITRATAYHPRQPSLAHSYPYRVLHKLGVTTTRLRVDRLLDEARHSADPVHMMRLFGISPATALKYVSAAHPDRQCVLPR